MDAGLIRDESTHNRTLYHLTEDGSSTIDYFKNNISQDIQKDVNEYLKEKKYDLKNESSVKADHYRNTNQEYSVHCQVTENALPLIDLTITVPSEAEAQAVTDNWQKKNQELYATIMAKLLG